MKGSSCFGIMGLEGGSKLLGCQNAQPSKGNVMTEERTLTDCKLSQPLVPDVESWYQCTERWVCIFRHWVDCCSVGSTYDVACCRFWLWLSWKESLDASKRLECLVFRLYISAFLLMILLFSSMNLELGNFVQEIKTRTTSYFEVSGKKWNYG